MDREAGLASASRSLLYLGLGEPLPPPGLGKGLSHGEGDRNISQGWVRGGSLVPRDCWVVSSAQTEAALQGMNELDFIWLPSSYR